MNPKIISEFQQLLGEKSVLHEPEHLALYEYDGALDRGRPDLVVFPTTTEQVSAIVRIANREKMPFHARGAGTGLSGGAIADQGGIMIAMARMKEVEIDAPN